jgi:hypothetical protein
MLCIANVIRKAAIRTSGAGTFMTSRRKEEEREGDDCGFHIVLLDGQPVSTFRCKVMMILYVITEQRCSLRIFCETESYYAVRSYIPTLQQQTF